MALSPACIQNPDPEDVKSEKEVREKAARYPLKLQALIEREQEQEARRKEGGSQRLYEFQFAQSGWQSIRPSLSVGRGSSAGSVHGTGAADLGRLAVAAAGRSKRGLKRRKTT